MPNSVIEDLGTRQPQLSQEVEEQRRKLEKTLELDPINFPWEKLNHHLADIRDRREASIRESLISRAKLLQATKHYSERQRVALLELCRRDPVFWINNFCWTFDPRRKATKKIPMLLFPRQEEYVRWRQERRRLEQNGLIEKSRDMGVSVVNVLMHTHSLLFEDYYKGTFGSRKVDLVDQPGNLNSLLEKVRFTVKSLPKWMQPQAFKAPKLNIRNLDNNSSIDGEGGRNAGRGGRSSVYDFDEFAFLEGAEQVDSAMSQTSDVLFLTSTPNRIGDLFYRKRFSGKMPVFRFNYYDHPFKNQFWLLEQRLKFDPIVVAREILIDYSAAAEGIMIPNSYVNAGIRMEKVIYGAGGAARRVAGMDIADDSIAAGTDYTTICIREGAQVLHIEGWKGLNPTESAYRALQVCEQWGVTDLCYDAIGVGAGVGGTFKTKKKTDNRGYIRKLRIHPVNANARASEINYRQFDDRKGCDIFDDVISEVWWNTRLRLERCYEEMQGIASHKPGTMLSLPNHSDLIAQLSQPLYTFTADGKIKRESKDKMKARGIKSPDFADALIYSLSLPVVSRTAAWIANA